MNRVIESSRYYAKIIEKPNQLQQYTESFSIFRFTIEIVSNFWWNTNTLRIDQVRREDTDRKTYRQAIERFPN